jgi:hypothetical protein
MTCGALLEDGRKCSQLAAVVKTDYVYDRRPLVGEPVEFALKEVHYHIVCPTCGEHKIVWYQVDSDAANRGDDSVKAGQ